MRSASARASADLPLAVGPAISASSGRSPLFIATLIAKDRLSGGDISAAEDRMAAAGAHAFARSWIEDDKACDLLFSQGEDAARVALEGALEGVDVVVQPEAERRRRLLVADMD